ncbi:EAL and HDOD domain-containing protein [Chitinimonas sp. PSY-7]|uniref:HDOD domain-containing protein n=1 Tax=Chitinimonas sp. PSY-7 TaxID=3459088 RepID=UPI00403FCF17
MFSGLIKKLFGENNAPTTPATKPVASKPVVTSKPVVGVGLGAAPGEAGFVAGAHTETMLQREIVVDRDLQIMGYNFRLRDSVLKRKSKMANSVLRLYDEVLLRNFLAEEATKAFGTKRIVLEVSVWALESPFLSKLPHGRFVLMVHYNEEYFQNAIDHVGLLQGLKDQGFQLGFDSFPLVPELMGLLPLADFHKLSVAEYDLTRLSQAISAVNQAAPESAVLVGDIHFYEELQVCRQMQVQYLQGSYLRCKELSEADAVDASYLRLIEVLNLVRADAEATVVANAMKYDPMLSFKLLRFVNSPGAGLVTKVDTLDRAMIVLGNKQLYRWLSLLLFGHERQEGDQDILLETALVRARMMETLGAKQFKRADLDLLFTVGMFSMLEPLLRQPMVKILEKLNLPADVNQALLERKGRFGPLLNLALMCEDGNLAEDPALFAAANVTKSEVNLAQLEAMLWVEEVV